MFIISSPFSIKKSHILIHPPFFLPSNNLMFFLTPWIFFLFLLPTFSLSFPPLISSCLPNWKSQSYPFNPSPHPDSGLRHLFITKKFSLPHSSFPCLQYFGYYYSLLCPNLFSFFSCLPPLFAQANPPRFHIWPLSPSSVPDFEIFNHFCRAIEMWRHTFLLHPTRSEDGFFHLSRKRSPFGYEIFLINISLPPSWLPICLFS